MLSRCLITALICLPLMTACTSEQNQPNEAVPQAQILAVEAGLKSAVFENGVKLVVEEDHSAPVAMVQIWLKVGGRDEMPGKTGLAHVFEHMMFKGSDKLGPGEFSKRIAAMGGNDNAFTNHDYTAYFETVPAAQVDEVLAMEAERFAHLKLEAKDFAKEIEVIKEERRMRTEDDPNSRMFEELSAASLRLHPYRNPVIGWMQDLERLDISDVRAFYRKHYVSGNVTVVVVGDVDFDHLLTSVGESFGQLKKQTAPARFNPEEPDPLGPKRVLVTLPAQLPLIAFSIPVPVWKPGENDREAAALAVATEIMAGGRSARLHREIVDKQRLAFDIGAGYDPFGMGLDLWYAYAALGPTHRPKELEAAFWKQIGGMAETPPEESSLAAAKRRIVASEVFARDSLYLRAKQIGIMETREIGAGKRDAWLDAIRQVESVDVRDAVKRWLKPERTTTGLLQPKAPS